MYKQAIEILQKLCNISEKEANEDPESMYKQGLREWFYIAKSRIQSLQESFDSHDEWISSDNPPTHFKNVLVIANWIISIASYDKMYDGWVYNDEIAYDDVITHWQELPALPPTSSQL